MEFIKKKLKGAFEIKLKPIGDSRGFFMRAFDDKLFADAGIKNKWVQENHSRSTSLGTIRGFHLQLPPFAETKLIRAIKGEALDVFVDLRLDSPTFGQWDSVLLSDKLYNYALIPKGFGHAICTLTEVCEVIYKVDNYYSPENEIGLMWDDKDINVEWPIKNPILSDKDQKNLTLKQFIKIHKGIKV
ncbi:dTDP-4-dehydrorhamnose 3,5-epimerase [Bacteroidota bacterium]